MIKDATPVLWMTEEESKLLNLFLEYKEYVMFCNWGNYEKWIIPMTFDEYKKEKYDYLHK